MGDNLYIARTFSNAALADLSAITAMEHDRSTYITQISARLATLQSGAKRLRARAIYQSAQTVIEGLNPNSTSQNTFKARLFALTRLVHQYVDGLTEVENDNIQNALSQDQEAPLTQQKDLSVERNADEDTVIEAQITAGQTAEHQTAAVQAADRKDTHNAAQTTLTSLMPLAREIEAPSLQRLIDYTSDPISDTDTAPYADTAAQSIVIEKPATILTSSATLTSEPQVPLEYILRDAIQDALSIARINAKTISISYDVGQHHIEAHDANALEVRLCSGLRALIMQSLPQTGIGHIDINLRGSDMVISSPHKQPRLLPKDISGQDSSNGCELTLPLIGKTPVKSPIPQDHDDIATQTSTTTRPMITAQTEQQLRRQLNTLLDMPESLSPPSPDLHMEDNIIVMSVEAEKKRQDAKSNKTDIEVGR
ncbi:MAG: hypothetical protein ABJG88_11935 [Litorimonas sp.]